MWKAFILIICLHTSFCLDFLLDETDIFGEDETKESRSWETQCRLPEFTAVLPLNYRREMKKIWGGMIVLGRGKCERQKQQTIKLIEDFPEDLKQKIIKWDEAQSEPINRTPFINGLSIEHIRTFTEVFELFIVLSFIIYFPIMTATQSVSQRSQRLREWGKDLLDSTALTQLEQYILFLERRAERFREKVKRLSPDARVAFERLQSLKRERQRLIDGFKAEVKKELSLLYRTKCPRFGSGDGADLDLYEMQIACRGLPEEKRKLEKLSSTTTEATTTTTTSMTVETTVDTTTTPSTSSYRSYTAVEVEQAPHSTTRRFYPRGTGGVPQLDGKTEEKPTVDENNSLKFRRESQNMNGYVDSVAMILQKLFPRNNMY